MGAGDGVPAKGKSKSKVGSANGRNSGAGPQSNQGSGNSQGPTSGAAAAPPRLGYGPKMTVGQGKQLSSKGVGRGGAGASGASIPRSGQPQHPQHPHQQPGANYKSGQNVPHQMRACAAQQQPGQAALHAPIRVRQAFKWTYNLRKKPIDKSRLRRLACPWPSGLLSGCQNDSDIKSLAAGHITQSCFPAAWTCTLRWLFLTERLVHATGVVGQLLFASFVFKRGEKITFSENGIEQKGPRLGTEHDQSPCKPDSHHVQQRPDLLEVVFKRRSTSQQVVALYLFSHCCIPCVD